MKELDKLINEFWGNNSHLKAGELEHFAIKCYNLGRLSKKYKEDDINPYHIDYERQGNLFEDDELTGI